MSATSYGMLALVLWSITSVLVAFLSAVPPIQIAAVAFFIAFVILSIHQIIKKEDIIRYWNQPIVIYLFWLAGPGLYTILLFLSYQLASPFEANTLNYLWPIFLVLLASYLHKTPLRAAHLIGAVIGFTGLVFVMVPPSGEDFFDNFKLGHVFALLSACIWPFYSAYRRKMEYPAGFLAPAFFFFSVICFFLHLWLEETVWPDNFEIAILLLLGFTRISYVLWDKAMKYGNVLLLTSLSYLLPLVTTISLIVFGFGPARPMIGFGAALIVAGCVIVNLDKILFLARKRAPKS